MARAKTSASPAHVLWAVWCQVASLKPYGICKQNDIYAESGKGGSGWRQPVVTKDDYGLHHNIVCVCYTALFYNAVCSEQL